MQQVVELLTPPARLAVAYAPHDARAAFALLLAFDARFADIASHAAEPLIVQMKFAWWRDSIAKDRTKRPKGEPLLSDLSNLDESLLETHILRLIDAWELILGDNAVAGEAVFAEQRSNAITDGFAMLAGVGCRDRQFMEEWAKNDLRRRLAAKSVLGTQASAAIPRNRRLRSLTILAMSVRGISGSRLIWHALTGG